MRLLRRFSHADESGQALVIVAALLTTLVILPVGVQMLATGQLPLATAAAFQQQALQAARAGLADYINHDETFDLANYNTNHTSYSTYCSNVAFSSCTNGPDTTNPAFVSGWAR